VRSSVLAAEGTGIEVNVEKISAVTLRWLVCGTPCGFTEIFWVMEIIYGARMVVFFAPRQGRQPDPQSRRWSFGYRLGRMIFYVGTSMRSGNTCGKGFRPESPETLHGVSDTSHARSDGHELSFGSAATMNRAVRRRRRALE